MRGVPLSADDALLARLQAPPDLHDGTEALAYWRRRRRHLPWYRIAARREAAQMTVVWEGRVRAALLTQREFLGMAHLRAGQLVAATWFRRVTGRVVRAFALATAVFVVLVAVPAVLLLELLFRALF